MPKARRRASARRAPSLKTGAVVCCMTPGETRTRKTRQGRRHESRCVCQFRHGSVERPCRSRNMVSLFLYRLTRHTMLPEPCGSWTVKDQRDKSSGPRPWIGVLPRRDLALRVAVRDSALVARVRRGLTMRSYLMAFLLAACGSEPTTETSWQDEPACRIYPPVPVSDVRFCASPDECPAPKSPCLTPSCVDGVCGAKSAATADACGKGWSCREDGACCPE
jgi:hypothetical protein